MLIYIIGFTRDRTGITKVYHLVFPNLWTKWTKQDAEQSVQVLTECGKGTEGSEMMFLLLVFLIIGMSLLGLKRKYECILKEYRAA